MTLPVSHYWIFTGHNSYLIGNQLSSDSSDEPIIKALQCGVRVVELDLWTDDKGGIEVTHGNTLTNPVSLEKYLIAIKKHALSSSVYPVCVTLEDHLTSTLQEKAAEMLTRILGEALYYPPIPDALTKFPSPESLKNRIIISIKPPKEYFETVAVAKELLKDETAVKKLEKKDAEEKTLKAPIMEDINLGDKVAVVQVQESFSYENPLMGESLYGSVLDVTTEADYEAVRLGKLSKQPRMPLVLHKIRRMNCQELAVGYTFWTV